MILIASSPILADEEPADLPAAEPWDMPRMSAMSDMRSTINCEKEFYQKISKLTNWSVGGFYVLKLIMVVGF
jgi:hypothetical protein